MRTAAAHPGSIGSILLETARFDASNHHSYLFEEPVRALIARQLDEIPRVFAEIESALAHGFYIAGYFAYECGYHFEPAAAASPGFRAPDDPLTDGPLIWLGVYRQPKVFDHRDGELQALTHFNLAGAQSPDEEQSKPLITPTITLPPLALGITPEDYRARILAIQELIAAGDTYQVNFTDRVTFDMQLPATDAFAALSNQQPVAYSAFLNLGDRQILSFSPELFFRIQHGKIITRPMKGTMPRGLDAAGDEQAALRLQRDEKNRSEHVMIVDLLRSDLGRICTMGSVEVEQLFAIERYQTLLQMTSTIAGALRPGISFYEIFRSLFPSGSITGAPKVRTMQIIRGLEAQPRGVYTGAIGFIAPDRSSVFNVAIRTLVLKNGIASMGVGGGIVADSDPLDEYRECLLKASFLTHPRQEFQLIETMLWEQQFRLLPLHLRRLQASALYFNFEFNRAVIEARLRQLALSLDPALRYRVRLLLARDGELTLAAEPFQPQPPSGLVRLSPQPTSSTNVFFRHKTTQRALYDRQHAQARAEGFDDVLFLNERGELTEGAISNVFLEQDGKLRTPPLACGVLDGVYRRHLLETRSDVQEHILTIADLHAAEAIYLCNALRGIYKVRLI